jgi:hypothetical protein
MWRLCASSSCATGELRGRRRSISAALSMLVRAYSVFRKDAGARIAKGLVKIREIVTRFSRMN